MIYRLARERKYEQETETEKEYMNKSIFIKKSANVVCIKRSLFPNVEHYMNVEYDRA